MGEKNWKLRKIGRGIWGKMKTKIVSNKRINVRLEGQGKSFDRSNGIQLGGKRGGTTAGDPEGKDST